MKRSISCIVALIFSVILSSGNTFAGSTHGPPSSTAIDSTDINLEKLEAINECNQCSFKGLNLAGKVFKSAQLDETDFSNSNLRKINLIGAYMHHSHFVKTDMTEAILKFTELSKGDFTDAIMINTDLTGAKLKYTHFTRANMSHAILKGTDLYHADFSESNLEGTDFSNSELNGVELESANIKGATFYGAKFVKRRGTGSQGPRGYSCNDIIKNGGLIDDKTICDR